MKAPSKQITEARLDSDIYPVYGSPKLDGYCCLCENGAFTSTLKPIGNEFIRRILSNPIYNGLHGEIVIGPPNHPDAFNRTTGPVRAKDGKPNFKLYVFDNFTNTKLSYGERYENLAGRCAVSIPFVELLPQVILKNKKEVRHFEKGCIDLGYEGAMIRTLWAPYKEGRCTDKEGYIWKLKPTEDAEGVIVGFYEKLKNNNEAFANELGLTRRSSHRENKEGAGTTGGFLLRTTTKGLPWTGQIIRCGAAANMKVDELWYIWTHKDEFMGRTGTYKYQAVGSIDLPRQAIWKGFRNKDDITEF
jgi:DNA ligase-1